MCLKHSAWEFGTESISRTQIWLGFWSFLNHSWVLGSFGSKQVPTWALGFEKCTTLVTTSKKTFAMLLLLFLSPYPSKFGQTCLILTDPNHIWTIGYMLICSSPKVEGGTQPSIALSLTRVWFRPVGSQMRHGTYCHTCPSQRRRCIIILHFWEELSVGKLKVWKSGEGELCQLTLNIITNKQSLVAKSQNDSNVRPPSVSTEQNQGLARPWALQWQSRRVRRGD